MKTKSRILSFFLAVVMIVTALPLTALQVSAADGDTPKVELDYEYDEDSFTMKAQITLSGGGIEQYGFAYSINGVKTLYRWFNEEIGKYEEFSHTISVDPGDEVWYQVIVKNEYGKTAKEDDIFNVPEEEPEIELDAPEITAPDVDDTFFAGDDITFKWGSVSDAEEFDWELYKGMKGMGGVLIDSGTTGTSSSKRKVKIDGDVFKANSDYNFYVWAVSGNATSSYDEVNIFIVPKPEELYVDPEELSFDAEGGEDYFDLTSSHDWEASISVSWIDLSAYEGAGDEEITVYVDENTGEQRTGFITIESDIGSIIVTIHQHSGITPYLTVSTTYIELPAEDGGWTFEISSNVGWEIFCDNDWIRNISQEDGYGDESIQILVNENTSTQSRTAIITIEGDNITRTVTVTQEGRPAIVGDINNDGEITNKDRFLLNRYLANMAGYTEVDKKVADINGDGSVNAADVEYLSRHLAGWVGYEKLPEINTGTSVCAHTQYTDTYCNTVYVSSTIKTNTTHTYYHVYNRKCNCGVDIGKVQGELIIEAHSYVNNLCACGAYNGDSYEKWTGVNVSGVQANVYSTPSATVRYGYINKDEVVTVIGEYGDKYLIEYTLDGGNGVKQGYVFADTIAYNISLEINEDYPFDINVIEYDDNDTLLFCLTPVSHGLDFTGTNGNPITIPYDVNIHSRRRIMFGIGDTELGSFFVSDNPGEAVWFVEIEKDAISEALGPIKSQASVWYYLDGKKIYYGVEGWGELIFKRTLGGITWEKHEEMQASAYDPTLDLIMLLPTIKSIAVSIIGVPIKEAAKIFISKTVKKMGTKQFIKYVKATGLEWWFSNIDNNFSEQDVIDMVQTSDEYVVLMEAYLEYGAPNGIGLLSFTRNIVGISRFAEEHDVSRCVVNEVGMMIVLKDGQLYDYYELS